MIDYDELERRLDESENADLRQQLEAERKAREEAELDTAGYKAGEICQLQRAEVARLTLVVKEAQDKLADLLK